MAGGPIFVAGTSKTGRRVAERLDALGISTRIGSRGSKPPFDGRTEQVGRGAGRKLRDLRGVSARCVDAGGLPAIERLIETRGTPESTGFFSSRDVASRKRAKRSWSWKGPVALDHRPLPWFMQNFSESFLINGVLLGKIMLPISGDVGEPFWMQTTSPMSWSPP